jgi:hypothetical protein
MNFWGSTMPILQEREPKEVQKWQNKKIIPANSHSNPEDAKKAERPPHR